MYAYQGFFPVWGNLIFSPFTVCLIDFIPLHMVILSFWRREENFFITAEVWWLEYLIQEFNAGHIIDWDMK